MRLPIDVPKVTKYAEKKLDSIRDVVIHAESTPQIAIFLEELNKEYRIAGLNFFIESLQHAPSAYIEVHKAKAKYLLQEDLLRLEILDYYLERWPHANKL